MFRLHQRHPNRNRGKVRNRKRKRSPRRIKRGSNSTDTKPSGRRFAMPIKAMELADVLILHRLRPRVPNPQSKDDYDWTHGGRSNTKKGAAITLRKKTIPG